MTAHSKLSPSARHRWGVCPGSVRESAKYPEKPSGDAAIDGTHSHTLLEWCLDNQQSPVIGMTLTDHEGEFTVDPERAERVEFALHYVEHRRQEIGLCAIRSEERVDLSMMFGRTDLDGTVDVQIIGNDLIEIIDYKDGMAYVAAKGNPQLEQYGFGAISPYIKEDGTLPFQTIRLTIIQPKTRLKGMSGIDSHEMPIDEFLTLREVIASQAAATDDPDAPLVPGEVQCKYCAHKGACTAAVGKMLDASGIAFEKLNVAKQAAEGEPNTMSDEQLRELIEAAPLLRSLLDAAEDEAMRRFEEGKPVDGLKVVRGRGSSNWALDDVEMATRLTKMGIPKSEVWETKLISPAKAKKLTWVKKDGTQKQLSERQVKLMETEYIKKSDGKLTIVPESDSRQAVTIGAAQMFGAVDSLPSWLS